MWLTDAKADSVGHYSCEFVVGWMLEIISAHLARVELRLWEHALHTKDAEKHPSATPFRCA
jgi:hypothetical protein